MGGYGGALKQLSIGCASTAGKVWIHSGGTTTDQSQFWNSLPAQDVFLAGMADAASAVVDYFHGSMAFVNVMKNLSVDCDCCAVAEDPCMKDIGILASLDPVAVDQACIDLIYAATDDPGQKHFIERVESLHGIHDRVRRRSRRRQPRVRARRIVKITRRAFGGIDKQILCMIK